MGPRGGKKKCRACFGSGQQDDHERQTNCRNCNGSGSLQETLYDFMPDEVWRSFTFKVYRDCRPVTHPVFSVKDSKRHNTLTDEALIENVRYSSCLRQGIKVANRDGSLCDHIGIYTEENAYFVAPVFRPNQPNEKLTDDGKCFETLMGQQKSVEEKGVALSELLARWAAVGSKTGLGRREGRFLGLKVLHQFIATNDTGGHQRLDTMLSEIQRFWESRG